MAEHTVRALLAEGRVMGDTTTLADPSVVEALKERYEEETAA